MRIVGCAKSAQVITVADPNANEPASQLERDAELAWITREAGLGNPAAMLILGADHIRSGVSRTAKLGYSLLERAEAAGQPAAPYYLGKCHQFGIGGQPVNARKAGAHYARGWLASQHIGCALGIGSLAEAAGDAAALAAHAASLRSLVDRPDIVALAQCSGSVSFLPDALWEVGTSMEANMQHMMGQTYGSSKETDAALALYKAETTALARLYRLGADLRDPHMMWKTAVSTLELRTGISGLNLAVPGGSADVRAALELCTLLVQHPETPPDVMGKALNKLGESRFNSTPPDYPGALRFFERAVASGAEAADATAVVRLTQMLYEGMGCAPDPVRGRKMMMLGCKMKIGASFMLAAQKYEEEGNRMEAAAYWKRAADQKMPQAIAVVEGITLEEANRRVFGQFSGLLSSKLVAGKSASSMPPTGDAFVERFRVSCAGCGKPGRISDVSLASPLSPDTSSQIVGPEDLSALSVSVLKGRLAALRIDTADCTYKADLVAKLVEAAGSVEARERALPTLQACGQCKHALYCGRECQTAHWRAHKAECKAKAAAGVGKARGEK